MALQTFDESYYLTQNPDVAQAVNAGVLNAEQHYLQFGQFEGRNPNSVFNTSGYVAANPDVVSAVAGRVFDSYLQHFEMYGVNEGREPGANTFNEANYLAANTDVADAVAAGVFSSGFEHFVLFGSSEGRDNGVVDDGTQGQTFTLTTEQDIFTGGAGTDVVRGVAGVIVGGQDQTTLNSSDILDGGAGEDSLVVNMTGQQYLGGATVKNIENLTIGTNLLAAAGTAQGFVGFDINVNQGAFEVTGVNTITYDQITTNEILVVQNVVPVAVGDVSPTMNWANENGSAAGWIATTYRQAAIQGAADNQAVILNNVDATQNLGDGVLAVGPGIESIAITSSGLVAQNTLNNSDVIIGNVNYADIGSNNTLGADILSRGSLTSVTLDGATAIGKGPGVIAATGLTDRVVGIDGGITNLIGTGTASNLLSVGSRVTSVDATAMTGNTFVRFVAKNDNSASNKTFAGGEAADYVEFENGNVTATGNNGTDTFAFINTQPNSTFGENDVLTGGADSDTIQLGLNGAGVFTVGQTELRNKTGIDVLDLRGANSTVTLSSDFVGGSDDGRVTIHTDRIVRTSVDNTANGLTQSNAEDASEHVTNLTFLGSGDGITYVGGSGSDRLILNDATFNVQQVLDGGLFDGYGNRSGIANTGDYDTLTVTTNGEQVVLDAQDLSQVSNFNGLVLTKNSATATYNITLTRSFLSANTLDQNDATNTNIDDTIFQIGTVAAANQSALSAGDTVTINVSDLLNNTNDALSTAGFVPGFDITALTDAGVIPNFVGNGGAAVALATLQGLGLVRADGPVPRADVMASTPNVVGAVGNNLTAQAAGFDVTSGFLVTGGLATTQDDTLSSSSAFLTGAPVIDMAGGTDTLRVTDVVTAVTSVGTNAALAASVGLEDVVLVAGSTANVVGAAGQDITANAAAIFTLTGAANGTGSGGADTITAGALGSVIMGNAGDDILNAAAGNDNLSGGDGADLINVIGGADTIDAGADDDTVFVALGAAEAHTVTLGAGNDNVLINNIVFANAQVNTVTVTDFDVTADGLAIANVNVAISNGVFYNDTLGFTGGATIGDGSILEISGVSFQYTDETNVGAVLTHMNGNMNALAAAAGDTMTVIAYNAGGDAAIYIAQDDGSAGAFDALELVGILENVGNNTLTGFNFA